MQKSKYNEKNLEFGQTEFLGFRHLTLQMCQFVIA
jgi:hypothetical protein